MSHILALLKNSTEAGNLLRGNVTLWKIHELSQNINFCPATQLQFLCSSIIIDLLNADWLKYNCFDLCSDFNVITAHSRP
jgi:hypothetical protein